MPLRSGFDAKEALPLIAICTHLNGLSPNAPQPAWPLRWEITNEITGKYDSLCWVLRDKGASRYAVAFRGTQPNIPSVLEDLEFKTENARGYALNPSAVLHRGFKRGFKSMSIPLKKALDAIPATAKKKGDLLVTGHSQGASEAAICGAYMRYTWGLQKKFNVKSYVFALPKPGNEYFAYDYNLAYTNAGWSFNVMNTLDFIPQLPLTIQMLGDLAPRFGAALKQHGIKLPGWMKTVDKFVEKLLGKTLDFAPVGAPITLQGVSQPKKDPGDALFQHHAGRYWKLIQDQLK